jgi:non-heme chloroperoxidase
MLTMPYLESDDGTRLYYIDGGGGAPVVFVSSAWLSSRMWEFQLAPLVGRGLRCIACDRRGHGRSDWPWGGYDYDTLADDLASLLERLDLNGVTLVAHSAGAGEVVRYLTRHGSGRVARIALVAGTTPFPMKSADNPDGVDRALMEADMAVRTADRPKWFAMNADAFLGIGLPGISLSPEFTEFVIRQCLDCAASAAIDFFVAGFTTDFRQELASITLPTLIVHGDSDVQAPLALCGRKAAALIRSSRILVCDNAAHGLFLTHAERLNADLLAFIGAGGD